MRSEPTKFSSLRDLSRGSGARRRMAHGRHTNRADLPPPVCITSGDVTPLNPTVKVWDYPRSGRRPRLPLLAGLLERLRTAAAGFHAAISASVISVDHRVEAWLKFVQIG